MDDNVRNRFYWHEEWDEMINGELTASLPDSVRVEIYRALTRYGCYHDFGDMELSDTAKGVISGCMRTLNAEWDAYLKQRDANRENGVKGGAPKGNRNARNKQPKTTDSVNSACFPISDTDNGSDIGIDNGYESDKEKESVREKELCYNFMAWYNEQIQHTELPQISEMTAKREKALKEIIKEFGKEDIALVVSKIINSNYLLGNTSKRFKANYDWVFKRENFLKIKEGNFDD